MPVRFRSLAHEDKEEDETPAEQEGNEKAAEGAGQDPVRLSPVSVRSAMRRLPQGIRVTREENDNERPVRELRCRKAGGQDVPEVRSIVYPGNGPVAQPGLEQTALNG